MRSSEGDEREALQVLGFVLFYFSLIECHQEAKASDLFQVTFLLLVLTLFAGLR